MSLRLAVRLYVGRQHLVILEHNDELQNQHWPHVFWSSRSATGLP